MPLDVCFLTVRGCESAAGKALLRVASRYENAILVQARCNSQATSVRMRGGRIFHFSGTDAACG
jgi:hypothetical protein